MCHTWSIWNGISLGLKDGFRYFVIKTTNWPLAEVEKFQEELTSKL